MDININSTIIEFENLSINPVAIDLKDLKDIELKSEQISANALQEKHEIEFIISQGGIEISFLDGFLPHNGEYVL